jgi:hypothetical protein
LAASFPASLVSSLSPNAGMSNAIITVSEAIVSGQGRARAT